MFNVDSLKRDTLIVVLLLIWLMFPVYLSWEKWNEHPKHIECDYDFGSCKMLTYKHERKICWNKLYTGHQDHKECALPQILEEEKELYRLNNIKDVTVAKVNDFYEIELVNRNDDTMSVAKYKNESDAVRISGVLLKNIKEWQSFRPDYFTEDKNNIFYYDFVE